MIRFNLPTAVLVCALTAPAMAQEADTSGFFSLGVAAIPAYPGADEAQVLPLVIGQIERGGRALSFDGRVLSADLVTAPHWAVGPALSYEGGRSDVDDAAIARLPEIDDWIGAGVRVTRAFDAGLSEIELGVTALADVTGTVDGWTLAPSVSWSGPVGARTLISVSATATIVSDEIATARFGSDQDGANASGLTPYDASGGLQSVGLSVTASHALSDRWAVTGLVGLDALVGDAADSPVSKSDIAPILALGLTRSF